VSEIQRTPCQSQHSRIGKMSYEVARLGAFHEAVTPLLFGDVTNPTQFRSSRPSMFKFERRMLKFATSNTIPFVHLMRIMSP